MTASALFTAAHATARTTTVGTYRARFAAGLKAAHVDARRAVVLPLPCASFYTAQAWNEASRALEVVYFATQKQLKDFVEANIAKSLSCYAHVTAWWGSAAAMQHDLATTGDISSKSLRSSRALGAEYREMGEADARAYVGALALAATEAEEMIAAEQKQVLAAYYELAGIEVDLD